jgi:uncharacterized surface protein with fasciclin (FAS1) repeats
MNALCGPKIEEMAMIIHKGLAVAVAAAAMTLTVQVAQAQNCMDVLSRTPEASSFVAALTRTGQTSLLRGPGPFTILAPTNEAASKVSPNLRTSVFGSAAFSEQDMDPVLAPAVMNAHIIDGKHTAAEVQAGASTQSFTTRNGNELKLVRGADGRFSLQPQGRGRRAVEGHVVRADIPCSNGVIHLVDTVLIRVQ